MRNAMLLVMGVMPMLWTFCPLAPVRPAVAGEDGTAGQTPKVERYYPDKLPNDWPDGPSRPPVREPRRAMVLPHEHAILFRAVARTGNPAFGVARSFMRERSFCTDRTA